MNAELQDYFNETTESDTHKEIVKVKDKVEGILEMDEKARNSDKWLIYQYAVSMGLNMDFEDFNALPSFESITRCRRKLQEKGQYLSDSQIAEKRGQREVEFEEWSKE